MQPVSDSATAPLPSEESTPATPSVSCSDAPSEDSATLSNALFHPSSKHTSSKRLVNGCPADDIVRYRRAVRASAPVGLAHLY